MIDESIVTLKATLDDIQKDGGEGYFASLESGEEAKAKRVVVNSLSYAPRTYHQLEQKLADKEFSEEVITKVLQIFEDSGLINDAEFARQWVISRSKTKKLASAALRRELRQKGVADYDIESALSELSFDEQRLAAEELIDSRLNRMSGLNREKKFRRLVSLLQRKGYPLDLSFEVVNRAIKINIK
ncbi:MAG: regulatory protein RecX [Micrococcaceae bacterium]